MFHGESLIASLKNLAQRAPGLAESQTLSGLASR